MRVLLLADTAILGGATKALKEVIAELKNNGDEPVVCTGKRTEFNDWLDNSGVKNIEAGYRSVMYASTPELTWKTPIGFVLRYILHRVKRIYALRKIISCADMQSIDIIHTNIARIEVGCILSRKYGIPHVMHLREFGAEDFNCRVLMYDYYGYLNKHCDVLLAVSDAVRRSWVKKGLDPAKCRTLYDGVDFENMRVKPDDSYDNETLRLVIAGGILKNKGQHIALKALEKLPENIKKNVTLDMIGWGDGAFIEELKKEAEENGISDRVSFPGIKDDLDDCLCGYDVGLMCSRCEGFGRVTAEYMYAGLGVAASDTGASPELVEDGKTGLVFREGDPDSLAECIIKFYNDRAFLKECGKNAHVSAAERFSAKRNFKDISAVYKELCRK